MLEASFMEVYNRFKLNYYRCMLARLEKRKENLSAAESFACEVIYALKAPTVSELAQSIGLSQPNATYRVNALVRKGYIEKIPSKEDKRELHLYPTQKFFDDYNISSTYIAAVMSRLRERCTRSEIDGLEKMLDTILDEIDNMK